MARTPLLITGFGPFLEVKQNPSGLAARHSGYPYAELEVSYRAARAFVLSLASDPPERALLLGVKRNADRYQFESCARNERLAVADNLGDQTAGLLEPDGPETLPSTLWPAAWQNDLPLDGDWSDNAGGYLCNALFYYARLHWPKSAVGFLHVPPLDAVDVATQIANVQSLAQLLTRKLTS